MTFSLLILSIGTALYLIGLVLELIVIAYCNVLVNSPIYSNFLILEQIESYVYLLSLITKSYTTDEIPIGSLINQLVYAIYTVFYFTFFVYYQIETIHSFYGTIKTDIKLLTTLAWLFSSTFFLLILTDTSSLSFKFFFIDLPTMDLLVLVVSFSKLLYSLKRISDPLYTDLFFLYSVLLNILASAVWISSILVNENDYQIYLSQLSVSVSNFLVDFFLVFFKAKKSIFQDLRTPLLT